MEQAGSLGLSKIAEQGMVFAVLVAIITALLWFIKYLLNELKESRIASTAAINNNTIVMTRIEELQRQAINR